jgi:hypothetical protein
VFGGRRPALFLKRELAARLGETFFPPAFFSMDEFMGEVAARHAPRLPLPAIDAAYLVYTIAREAAPAIVHGRESFSRFLPWAGEIVSFIDHADLEAIPDAELVNVQHNAAIGYDVPETINTLLKYISEIRKAYHEALEKDGLVTHGLGYRLAAQHIAETAFDETARSCSARTARCRWATRSSRAARARSAAWREARSWPASPGRRLMA